MLKVSRGPVRQAIFRLQQEGLVTHEPHRGATVAEVSAAATIGSGIFCASPTRQARPPKRSILMPAEGGALGTEHGRDRMAVALADDDDGLALAALVHGDTTIKAIGLEVRRLKRNRPSRSTLVIRSHSSTGKASMSTRWAKVFTPALLTRMSSPPNRSSVAVTAGSIAASSRMSTRQARRAASRPPPPRHWPYPHRRSSAQRRYPPCTGRSPGRCRSPLPSPKQLCRRGRSPSDVPPWRRRAHKAL